MKKILLLPTLAVASFLMVSCGGLTPSLPTKTTATTTTTPITSSTTTTTLVTQTTTSPVTSTSTSTVTSTTDDEYEKKIVVYAGVSNKMMDLFTILEAGFELEYPGWDVEIVNSSSPIFVSEEINSIISSDEGKLPNIAYANLNHVQNYIKTGKLLDLTPYITSNTNISYYNSNDVITAIDEKIGLNIDDFAGKSLLSGSATSYADYQKYGYNEDSLLAMPICASTDLLYYNKTVFDELNLSVPTTWDELWDVARTLKNAYPNSIPFGFDSTTNFISNICYQNDYDYLSSTKPYVRVNNDNFKAYINALKPKYDEGLFTSSDLNGSPYLTSLFLSGINNGMFMYYGSLTGAAYNTTSSFEVGVSQTVGSVNANKVVCKNLIQGPNLCAFDSGNEEVNKMAWLFMKNLYDADIQATYSAMSGYAPVIKSAYQSEVMKNFYAQGGIVADALKVTEQMADSFYTSPTFENKFDLLDDLSEGINKFLKGNITLDKAIEDTIEKYYPAPISLKRAVTETSDFLNDGIGYATLSSVTEGDNIVVSASGVSFTLRLMGINTPDEGEALSTDAKNFVKGLLDGATSIVLDTNTNGAPQRDSTGQRYLGYVWFKTANDEAYRNLNLEIVEKGFSKSFVSPGDSYYKYFVEAAKIAKENNLGIWNL